MKKILIAASLLFAFMLLSCDSGMTVRIDNPTGEAITVAIDNQTFEVAPHELLQISGIKKGDHTMSLNGGEGVNFNLESEHIILNPTMSTYVIVRQEYGSGFMSDHDFVTLEVDGREYTGPFQLLENEPYIETHHINCDTTRPFPEESTHSQLHKVFRWDDFTDFYRKEYR